VSVPRYWREIRPRYRLLGVRCRGCGKKFFPRRAVCPGCGGTDFEDCKLPERGRVVSWTVVRSPPAGYERFAPYVVGLIELEDGVRLLSQVVDVEPGEVEGGMEVEAVFRKVREDGASGIIEYGYKFRPVVE